MVTFITKIIEIDYKFKIMKTKKNKKNELNAMFSSLNIYITIYIC